MVDSITNNLLLVYSQLVSYPEVRDARLYPELAQRVRSQRELQPGLYGAIDFDAQPYRTTTDPADRTALPEWVADRAPYLADARAVELICTATLLGDVVADPTRR